MYHNPFKNEFFTQPVSLDVLQESFPKKVGNLLGHKFMLLVYANAPFTMFQNHTFAAGVNYHIANLLTNQWNATYKTIRLSSLVGFTNIDQDPMYFLLLNKCPYMKFPGKEFDLVDSKKTYNLGIFITSRRIDDIWDLIGIYFSPSYVIGYGLSIACLTVLFNWLILKRRGLELLNFNTVVPISLGQSVNLWHTNKKFYRLFIITVVWFFYLLVAIFNCALTSKMINYMPDERIRTINDLMAKNISVSGPVIIKQIVSREGFGMTDEFLRRIEISDMSMWSWTVTRPKSAYVVDVELQKYYLDSATNLNEYGRAKYYKTDHLIVSLPFFYYFPLNSPFSEEFARLISHISSAGLENYWLMKEFRQGNMPYFKRFATDTVIESIAQDFDQLQFIFLILCFGLGFSCLVFAIELVVYYYL